MDNLFETRVREFAGEATLPADDWETMIMEGRRESHDALVKAQKRRMLRFPFLKEGFEVIKVQILEHLPALELLDLTTLTEDQKSELYKMGVEFDPVALRYVPNPSEELKLNALYVDGNCIAYIKNPTENEKFVAVRTFGPAIRHIKDPSPRIQMTAVRQSRKSIQNIANATKEVLEYVYMHPKYKKSVPPDFIEKYLHLESSDDDLASWSISVD